MVSLFLCVLVTLVGGTTDVPMWTNAHWMSTDVLATPPAKTQTGHTNARVTRDSKGMARYSAMPRKCCEFTNVSAMFGTSKRCLLNYWMSLRLFSMKLMRF